MEKLTALQVKNAKPGRHADGKGLYLLVKPSGAKSWVLRVVVSGRRRDFGLGSADLVSLAEAREKAVAGRRMAKTGRDPSLEWRKVREVSPTFADAARRCHDSLKGGWKDGKHGAQWLATLRAYAFPSLGETPVDQIDAAMIQAAMVPIWLVIPETARRVRQRIKAVLDFAHLQGWRTTEAPMSAVAKGLPRQPRRNTHFPSMPYAQVPALMAGLRSEEVTVGRLALQFLILTAARSGEVRGATWEEIDDAKALWIVPAGRMKAGEAHSVPLSAAALEILKSARAMAGGTHTGLVFPGLRDQPLSDMTLGKALRAAVGRGFTVHGFRSSFRDWVAEQTTFSGDWAEAALAHTLPNRVEAAYRRTKYVEQRRQLMAAWADYLDGKFNVVRLPQRRAR